MPIAKKGVNYWKPGDGPMPMFRGGEESVEKMMPTHAPQEVMHKQTPPAGSDAGTVPGMSVLDTIKDRGNVLDRKIKESE